MCKIKSGVQIGNEMDLQNMIVGIILRQQHEYQEKDIIKIVIKYSEKAPIDVKEPLLKKMVQDNLDLLYRLKRIRCLDGVYTPIPIDDFY